ncbi:MAG: ATP-binding protein [Planctomycetota bacterium]|jgi:signal transduction histidine kinase
MAETKLIISEATDTREVLLDPKGMVIGRGANCDIVLFDDTISRLHARIYQDSFGRWVIEDLGSHNGVYVEGQRIKAQVVFPGQKITISHFTMSLFVESDEPTIMRTTAETTIQVIDKGLEENVLSYKADQAAILSPALMQHLNEFTDRLLKLSGPSELYPEACLSLANILDTLVAIVRLPCDLEPLPKSPDVLACYFGGNTTNSAVLETASLYLSKRVLDAVRSSDTPVMANSDPSAEKRLLLTVVDKSNPHVVFSARVNDLGETIDALYIDILEIKASKEMFDFVEAVARQINFVQKTLFFNELQKQEKALREANTQLKEKDHIKDEYVSRVTHDIKGHLNAIQSCLHVACDKSTGPLNEKQFDYFSRARRRTSQLSDFVKELLDLTQMRLSGKFETTSFSLQNTLSRTLETVETKAKDKSITLTSNIDSSISQIVGNQLSINELITNLLFNAIKYTPVRLEAKSHDDCVQIDIRDTGIGIPANELENVFDEFFRATNAKQSNKDGTGLGLSIAKQIVERHKGVISVQSREGQGTVFTVTLPK